METNDRQSMELRTHNILLRVKPGEKKAFQNAADLSGIPLSAWIRERLRRAAIQELEDAALPIAFLENVRLR
jgi:uncharacterized protein (DUF1778 family)